MRTVVASILLLSVAAITPIRNSSSPPPHSPTAAEAVRKISHSVAVIRVQKRGNWGVVSVTGSGIVVADGRVLTCGHVVANSIKVTVSIGANDFGSEVIADDPASDLALLAIDTPRKCFQAVTFAARPPELGEPVVAVGHPFDYRHTATTGVISGADREIAMPSGHTLKHLLQTSAPLNPGNSGGPLVNLDGEVVGLNAAIRDNAQCIGFVVPVPTIRAFLESAK
jgi:serine protease Do